MNEVLLEIMNFLKEKIRDKLEAQGHGVRGNSRLIDDIDNIVIATATLIRGEMYLQDYYIYVERGVRPSNIPYTPGSRTGAGKSAYIQALIEWFMDKRGLSEKEAKGASFATARVHSMEGMPTQNSFNYSKDGTRLGFLETTLERYDFTIQKLVEDRIGREVELAFLNILDNAINQAA